MIALKRLSLFLIGFLIFSAVGLQVAYAAETLKVDSWKKDFSKAVQKNDLASAKKLLNTKNLVKSSIAECLNCESKKNLESARKLFAKGKYQEALSLYNKIPKGSDQWLTTLEEKGWAYFRMKDYEKALAQTKTLLSPSFAGTVGVESYFLQSLSELQICDYKSVFETHKIFKEKQKARILKVQSLASDVSSNEIQKMFSQAKSFPLNLKDLGEEALSYPQLFHRDTALQTHALNYRISQAGLQVLQESTPARLNSVQKQLERLNRTSLEKLTKRIQILAQEETESNKKLIQKMNLVEVEAIQRMHADIDLADETFRKGEFRKTSDNELIFMDDGRPWIDELDKYEVIAKSCPQNVRRKM